MEHRNYTRGPQETGTAYVQLRLEYCYHRRIDNSPEKRISVGAIGTLKAYRQGRVLYADKVTAGFYYGLRKRDADA